MKDNQFLDEKRRVEQWFFDLQKSYCRRFEALESEMQNCSDSSTLRMKFETKITSTRAKDGTDRGGGVMAVMCDGQLFEKVGINASKVHGIMDENALKRLAVGKSIPGDDLNPKFWASGISLVAHMQNPKVPAVHFNTRMFWTPNRWWFGGGTDLNPSIEFDEDTETFHKELKNCCDKSNSEYYQRFRAWADSYFFIRHRNRPRGVGGIFFDDLNTGDWEADFRFVKDVGRAFLKAYLPIVLRRKEMSWTSTDRNAQLEHRGLYAEFNLVYDRGTKFGLESGHDPAAVLMSLPPLARWP